MGIDIADSFVKERRTTKKLKAVLSVLNEDIEKQANQHQRDLPNLNLRFEERIKQQEQNHITHLSKIKTLHDAEISKQVAEVQRLLEVNH